jgi:hypothetical protein
MFFLNLEEKLKMLKISLCQRFGLVMFVITVVVIAAGVTATASASSGMFSEAPELVQ